MTTESLFGFDENGRPEASRIMPESLKGKWKGIHFQTGTNSKIHDMVTSLLEGDDIIV